jgi:ankyrin repeat protein
MHNTEASQKNSRSSSATRQDPPDMDRQPPQDSANRTGADRRKKAMALKTRKAADTKSGSPDESASEKNFAVSMESSSHSPREASRSPKKSGKAANPPMGKVRVVRRNSAGRPVHRDDSSVESESSTQQSESSEEKTEKRPGRATQAGRGKNRQPHGLPGSSSTRRSAVGLKRRPRLDPGILKLVKPHTVHMAAALGDPESVRAWLKAHPEDIEKTDYRHRTPLLVAVRNRNCATTRALLAAGADANASDLSGLTPLAIAADTDDTTIAAVLLEAKASVDKADKRRRSPLIRAATKGHVAMVKYLVAAGADVNWLASGTTALMEAANCSDLNVATILIEAGAHADAQEKEFGLTALALASTKGRIEFGKFLIKANANLNAITHTGATALSLAAQFGHGELVKALIDAGADLNLPDKKGLTPLMRAVQNRHVKIVESLLNAGARYDLLSNNGESMFDMATKSGRPALVDLALEQQAEPLDMALVVDEMLRYVAWLRNENNATESTLERFHLNRKLRYGVFQGLLAGLEQMPAALDELEQAVFSNTGVATLSDVQLRLLCANVLATSQPLHDLCNSDKDTKCFYVDLSNANARALLKAANAQAKCLVGRGESESAPFHDFVRQLPVQLRKVASLAPPRMTTWLCTARGLHPVAAALIVQAWSAVPAVLKLAGTNREASALLATGLSVALKEVMRTDAFMASLGEASNSLLVATFLHTQLAALHSFSMTTLLAPHVGDATLAEIIGAVTHRALSFREAAKACGVEESRFDHWIGSGKT